MTQNSGKGFTQKKVKVPAFHGVSFEIRTADVFLLPLGGRRDVAVLAITYFLFSPLSTCDVSSGRQL